MTKNFQRILVTIGCYVAFFVIPVVSPLGPKDLLIRCGIATLATVTMMAGFIKGTWTERITCAALGSPALWYLVRTVLPIIMGGITFADA